ncbi:MAG: MFS transporter [Chloroflexi bacterium]|nr:MFS transporter [Chloroflexota bacterium]
MISESHPERSVWRNGPFVRLWTAQAISQTAQNAIWYGLLVLVEQISHSTTQLSITILSVVVPAILFGVPAGVYVDRWDKRAVLIATNLVRCFVVASYVLLQGTLALLYVVSFFFSVVSQFFGPAELAMIPAVVGRRKLMEATSLFHLTFTVSQAVGLVFVGPLIVKLFGTQTFFLLAAALYGVCTVLVWALPRQPGEAPPDQGKRAVVEVVSQVREVLDLVLVDRTMLWSMVYWTVGVGITLMVAMVAPRFVVDVLGIAPEDAVFIVGPAFLGTVLAAALLSRSRSIGTWGDRQRLIRRGLIVVAAALTAIAALPVVARTMGLLRPQGVAVDTMTQADVVVAAGIMLATFVGGLGFTALMVGSQTSLQDRAPPEARGRVFAVQLMLGSLCSAVPLVFFGGIADLVGVGRVMFVLAGIVLVISLIGRRFAPTEG